MSALAERIRKSRQTVVETLGHRVTGLRPSHLEVLEMQQADGGMNLRNCLKFVIGWDLKESDLVPGGVGEDVPFDTDAFVLWAEDNPQAWGDIMQGIVGAYQKHAAKLEADAGN